MKKTVVWNPELFKKHFETLTQNNILLSSSEKRKLLFYFKELHLKDTDILLDAGCGYGRLSMMVKNDVKQIIGIDINADNISYAKEYVGEKFVGHVVDMSSGVLPFGDKSINKVVIDNVLMFLNENAQIAFFKEVKRILTDGGVVAFNFENSAYFLKPLTLLFTFFYKLKAKLRGAVTPHHFSSSLSFYEKVLKDLGFINITSIGDTFYNKIGIGPIEVFPKFLHPYIAKLDMTYSNTSKKNGMSSLTMAATLK